MPEDECPTDPGTDWDENGDVVGFGLTQRPTAHRFIVSGRTLLRVRRPVLPRRPRRARGLGPMTAKLENLAQGAGGKFRSRVRIQLLHVPDCPLVDQVRSTLRASLAKTSVQATIEEVEGPYPSPTLLINGTDVTRSFTRYRAVVPPRPTHRGANPRRIVLDRHSGNAMRRAGTAMSAP